MKKTVVLLLVFVFLSALTACNNAEPEQFAVYSFSGENEQLAVENGTVVMSGEEYIFYGGRLRILAPEDVGSIAGYRAVFYTLTDGEQETVYVEELNNDSSSEIMNIDFGKMVSTDSGISKQFENIDQLQGNFWCELQMTDEDGNVNNYTVDLTLIAITD